jgi:AIR synthase related protein, C-terminal domain
LRLNAPGRSFLDFSLRPSRCTFPGSDLARQVAALDHTHCGAVVSGWATYSGVVHSGNTGHLTREGLAAALNEIAAAWRGHARPKETVPVREFVHGACEILGLDPLYVANEGRFAIVPLEHADAALDVLLRLPVSQQAARIGIITEKPAGTVALESRIGGNRVLDMRSGEQLPRIC